MRRLLSIYERNFPPYPANLNMLAYTSGMQETIGVKCEVMVLHYTDEFGRFYVYEDNWREITNQTLDNLLAGKVKLALLKREMERENKKLLQFLTKPLKKPTGQLLQTINGSIVRLISAGDPAAYLIEEVANRRLAKQLNPETITTLTKPTQKSFLAERECKLAAIANRGDFNALKKFSKNYPHFIFDYTGPISDYKFFKQRYDELRKNSEALKQKLHECLSYDQETQRAKNKILRSPAYRRGRQKIAGEDIKIAEVLAETAQIFDTRKGYLTRTTYLLSKLLDQLARDLKVKRENLNWLTPNEVVAAADHKLDLRTIDFESRGREGLFLSRGKQLVGLDGKEKQRWIALIKTSQRQMASVKKITGTIGSKGFAQGRARVIFQHRDIPKMQQGEILVTPYTAVNFLPAMRKAAAIVTDLGGITSHAAVVSRELGIPAVVDTKVATKTLKTGYRVEVDATKGVVRKL